jgi:ubiquinone/menaquinone biosynthesis C-methylase UbiE
VSGLGDRITFTEGDVAALPYQDGTFDLIVSTMSQHHWPDAGAGMRDLRRVLRPDGSLWVYDLRAALGRAETAARAAFPGSVVRREPLRSGGLLRSIISRVVVAPR